MNEPRATSHVTRRQFLQNTSAAASLTLLGGISIPHVHAASDDTIKIALIGCGGRGSGAANQALATGNVKLVAMADPFKAQIRKSIENLKRNHPGKVEVPEERQFTDLDGYKSAIAA